MHPTDWYDDDDDNDDFDLLGCVADPVVRAEIRESLTCATEGCDNWLAYEDTFDPYCPACWALRNLRN